MIVTVSLGDDLAVQLEDGIEEYNPIRTREMTDLCVTAFGVAYRECRKAQAEAIAQAEE